MGDLDGKVLVVTGATQGIGEAAARAAAAAGAAGIVVCGRNQERGEKVAADLSAIGTECRFVACELADPEQCRHVISACDETFGRIDGLVNAAGITDRGGILDISVELWDRLFAVNVRAPFVLIQEAAKLMKRDRRAGSIVNIITMSSHGGQPFLTGYAASKGALVTLTRNVAHALRTDRIRVNALNIGWADTPNEHKVQIETMGAGEDWLQAAEASQPFGQLIKPREVADFVVFLLSSRSGVMTGSVIDYDQMVMGAYD
ncbi:MAG: SDR family oxidoreductase [Alphaproteobacteria bacterium]|nr:SDR family oxidoreductase [Alphaproteobacteria bacterium]